MKDRICELSAWLLTITALGFVVAAIATFVLQIDSPTLWPVGLLLISAAISQLNMWVCEAWRKSLMRRMEAHK